MKRSIVASLVLIMMVGCTVGPSRNAAMNAWRSPSSTIEERAQAVADIISPGTPFAEVKRILGKEGRWVQRHGTRFTPKEKGIATNEYSTSDFDETTFDYEFPGGVVLLSFDIAFTYSNRDQAKFIKATFGKRGE